MFQVVRTTSDNPDFQKLVAELDAILAIMDGEEHAFFSQFNSLDAIKNVVLCYENEMAVGCGAFKKYDSKTAEIKRMFVVPDFRGKRIATKILSELELWATELDFSEVILETGTNNPNAIALYQKSGFIISGNYGNYIGVKSSCCMKKTFCKNY
jgi:putative acetyltransferase